MSDTQSIPELLMMSYQQNVPLVGNETREELIEGLTTSNLVVSEPNIVSDSTIEYPLAQARPQSETGSRSSGIFDVNYMLFNSSVYDIDPAFVTGMFNHYFRWNQIDLTDSEKFDLIYSLIVYQKDFDVSQLKAFQQRAATSALKTSQELMQELPGYVGPTYREALIFAYITGKMLPPIESGSHFNQLNKYTPDAVFRTTRILENYPYEMVNDTLYGSSEESEYHRNPIIGPYRFLSTKNLTPYHKIILYLNEGNEMELSQRYGLGLPEDRNYNLDEVAILIRQYHEQDLFFHRENLSPVLPSKIGVTIDEFTVSLNPYTNAEIINYYNVNVYNTVPPENSIDHFRESIISAAYRS